PAPLVGASVLFDDPTNEIQPRRTALGGGTALSLVLPGLPRRGSGRRRLHWLLIDGFRVGGSHSLISLWRLIGPIDSMLIYPITPLLSRVASAALGSFFLPLFRLLVLEKILHSSDF